MPGWSGAGAPLVLNRLSIQPFLKTGWRGRGPRRGGGRAAAGLVQYPGHARRAPARAGGKDGADSMTATIAVIGALEKEVQLIREELEDAGTAHEAGLAVARGRRGGHEVVAATAGMGTVNVAAATQHLLSRYGAGTVIFSGIAGGLNPALHIGDVVIGQRLLYLDTDANCIAESAPFLKEFASTGELADIAEEALVARGYQDAAAAANGAAAPGEAPPRYLRGTIATGNRYVTGAAAKDAVLGATGADCVEMEGAAVAHVAAKNGARCLVLRAISDNCDESYEALSARQFDLTEYARSASSLVLSIIDRLPAR